MSNLANASETSSSSAEVQKGSNRVFGLFFTLVFALVSAYPLISEKPLNLWAGGISAAFLAISLVKPSMLGPLNKLWLSFGLLLEKISSPLFMGLIFFSAVLPIGLLIRLLGKRPLALNFDPDAKSYWIKRGRAQPSPESMIPGLSMRRVPDLLILTSVPFVTFCTNFSKSISWSSKPGFSSSDLISLTMICFPESTESVTSCLKFSCP